MSEHVQETLSVSAVDPRTLRPAPWNPNRLGVQEEAKLDASLARHGLFKPVVARVLPDGGLQTLGGHFRVESAIRLGFESVPVVILDGVSDERAREITLIDNGRYGHDDSEALANLIGELGDPIALSSFMPFDAAELEAISQATRIDLETLGLDDEEAPAVETRPTRAPKTHTVMRFQVSIEDAEWISDRIRAIQQERGFTESDALTNAGDALSYLLRNSGL